MRAPFQGCAARVFPVWPCAVLRGEEPFRAGNARAWRRAFLRLMTRPQPAQALLLPTTCTALAHHAPLLLFCCYRRLPHAPCSPRAGLNRPVMPPAPGSQRGRASPLPPARAMRRASRHQPFPPRLAAPRPPPPRLPHPALADCIFSVSCGAKLLGQAHHHLTSSLSRSPGIITPPPAAASQPTWPPSASVIPP